MIIFSHANSYGAGTYRTLIDQWRKAGQDVAAVERFAHGDGVSVDKNWRSMTQQLIDLIDAQSRQKVWLVGHSMGGFLSLLAAGQRSGRIQGIVLLDAPVIGGWRTALVGALKATGVMQRVPPATVALRRRDHWPDSESVLRHFADKPMFACWHPDVLRSYVESGTEPHPDRPGRRLSFRPSVEAALYASVPHTLTAYLKKYPPHAPIAFIGGKHSKEVRQVGMTATRRLVGDHISWLDGSHLFPFERPAETAQEVLQWMQVLESHILKK